MPRLLDLFSCEGGAARGYAAAGWDVVGVDMDHRTGLPWIIENVPRAPLINPLTLCGTMFRLRATDTDGTPLQLRRHRLFESNVFLYPPAECDHDPTVQVAGAYGGGSNTIERAKGRAIAAGGYTPAKDVRAALLGVDPSQFTLHGLGQMIPPAYTRWLGLQLLEWT